jgi:hypothetical protein
VNEHSLHHVFERIEGMERAILERLNQIMSAVTDFAAKVTPVLSKVSADLDSIQTDITALNAQITAFNNSPGTLSATDQAALDAIATSAAALQTKADAVVPPVLPPVPAA